MDVRLTWTDCDKAGDYDVPNMLSPRDLVSRPDNMDETVLHTGKTFIRWLMMLDSDSDKMLLLESGLLCCWLSVLISAGI